MNIYLNLFNHWLLDSKYNFTPTAGNNTVLLEDWSELWRCKKTNNITKLITLTCLLGFIVVFLLGCSLYLLLGQTYTTPIAFEPYFKGLSLSFSLATPYFIWEHQNFSLNIRENKLYIILQLQLQNNYLFPRITWICD